MRILVEKERLQQNDAGYFYASIGSEAHGRPSFRLWVNRRLIQKDEDGEYFVSFPVQGRIVRTEKGNLVLRPEGGVYTYNIFIRCGYRGDSSFTVEGEGVEVFHYEDWDSPRGNLGVNSGALVVAKSPITVHWQRSGRTYGDPTEGSCIITPTGEVGEIIADQEVCDLLE